MIYLPLFSFFSPLDTVSGLIFGDTQFDSNFSIFFSFGNGYNVLNFVHGR